ncbi:unnamed protein product [Lymnaea stagnalis]|uniref:ABC-type xenobiotic transporter n=1 Tax=Lymnaea stagnalis TaxID=6523 RepID=A0AAV2HMR2_LYMST
MILITSPVLQIIFSVSLEHMLPSIADGVVAGISLLSWSLHAMFVWNLRYLHENSLRGPLSAVIAFMIVLASCAIHVHTAIARHISQSPNSSKTEEVATYVNASASLIYLMSLMPNHPRIYQTNLHLQINDEDGSSEPLTWDRIRSYGAVNRSREVEEYIAEKGVGCFSWLTFYWVQPLMSRGAIMNISSVNDLFLLPDRINTQNIDSKFKQVLFDLHYQSNLKNSLYHEDENDISRRLYDDLPSVLNNSTGGQIKLFKALNKTFGKEYYSLGVLKLVADSLGFAGPVLLNYLVSFIEAKSDHSYKGYLFALGLFLTTFLGTLCSTQFDYNVQVVAYKMRSALVTTIYRKSLLVSGVAQSRFSSGEIVNFMSTDTDRILNYCPSFHAFWSLPFQVSVSLLLLYQQVGLAFLAGVAFALLLIPINRWIAGKIGQLSTEMMAHKDDRVKLMNELLFGIRVVKLYSWEKHFTALITDIRNNELRCLKGRKYLDAMCVFFWATAPVLMSILTFTTFVLLGHQLTAAKVFTSLSLFLMLISPLNSFPWVINGLVEAWVSLKRVEKFVCLPDSDAQQYYSSSDGADNEPVIDINNASFTWMSPERTACATNRAAVFESSPQEPCIMKTQDLEGIHLKIFQGQYIGIVGKVGSGKSSLFSAIIGEMRKKQGEITVHDLDEGFAYVGQESWIQHATIRDNILFGRPYVCQKYDSVLEACALVDDLKVMPAGDMTEVGENGITLSGGQRARVALARAVYQDKAVYLLDDPLSAVDAHVAKHIYTNCIMGLLRGKTRLLCTHHVKFLNRADYVILMEAGRIVHSGRVVRIVLSDEQNKSSESVTSGQESSQDEKGNNLVQEEDQEKGAVKGFVYKTYWRAVGSCLSPLVLVTLFLMQASRNGGDWWLSYWVSHSPTAPGNQTYYIREMTGRIGLTKNWFGSNFSESPVRNQTDDKLMFYLGVYGGLAGANSFFTLLRSFLFAYGGLCAAQVIHKRLLMAILKAPLTFFDVTPIGRIVNRFSSDLYAVDDSLPFTLNIFLAQSYGIFGTLVLTCYGLPWFAICLVPMAAIYYKIQHYYRFTSRELKRLSSVTLSPIYAHFSETITGLPTIRSMRHSQRFCEENKRRLDTNQRAQYATQLSSSWLDLRLRMLGVAMVTCLSLIAVIQHQLTTVDAGLVGLAISYSLSVTNLLGGVVMFFTATEKEFVSVERCQHYIQETPSERWEGPLFPPSMWPENGVVEFDTIWLQYRDTLTHALKGVSFKTRPREKIGIVGRTGAGKSSLFLALFRLVEIGQGRILVDDVDISHLDLQDIRTRFAIIPQDPFLFSGTVRMNLDPTNSYSDADVWSAIGRCHLHSCIDQMGGLGAVLAQKGREFSVGQRQLLCLARAMLTKAKVLCIDEATASVDMETDNLIQTTIRHEFRESTVLTIAHRIHTVLDSHRVLVLKDGRVAEFASPGDLLQNTNSLFYNLVYGNN